MVTGEEVQALAQLLQRTPLTHAEALWVNGLLPRLEVAAQMLSALETPAEPTAPPPATTEEQVLEV